MGRVKIPYYVVVKGRGYWQPTAAMREAGFRPVPCGLDGPEAWKTAAGWNTRWQAFRRGADKPAVPVERLTGPDRLVASDEAIAYPEGSLGDAFRRYRRTHAWAGKAPATRDDWWRGWKRIAPVFGDVDPRTVELEDVDAWIAVVRERAGEREAHRAMKIWRALWKVAAAMRLCIRDADPSLGIRNRAAAGRTQTWTDGEIARLVKAAWRGEWYGLAAAIAVMWDTQLSPGDVRALSYDQLRAAGPRHLVFTTRDKTDVPVGGILSRRTSRLVAAYITGLGYTPISGGPIFRTRPFVPKASGGRPRPAGAHYSKNIMEKDFRAVRTEVFGLNERRQMLDIRRSGAVEAIVGGATAEELALGMGNTIGASNALFATYVPVNVAALESVAAARREGRRKIRAENAKRPKV